MIGEVLRAWRMHNEIGIRVAAKMIGTSAATLSRIERGEAMDGKTMYKLISFLLEVRI